MKKHTKGKALAGDGHEQGLAGDQISIESDDGDTLALYTWHWLTATYTGTDKGLKNIVWAAQQASFPSEYSQYDYNQILVMFDPPTSELINNQARTKVLIYGAFLLPANAAKGVDIYARALEPQVSVQRGVKNFPCTVPSVPSGNIMSLTSLEGNPLEADKAFHMFAATYSTYDGKAPSQSAGFVNWSARIVGDTDARVERIFPYDGDGLTQYLSNQEPQYSLYGFRVISSVPTLVDVTATMTVPEQFSRTIRVLFQENAALPLAGIMEFTPQDPMPWPVTDRNEPRRVWLNYSRPGGVPEKTRIHWWAFEVLTTKIGVSRTFVDKDGNTTNDVSRILSYGDDDDKGRIRAHV